jgi:lysozyme family protein
MKYLLVLATLAISSCQPVLVGAADIRPALVHTFGSEGGFQKMSGDSGNYVNGKLVGTKYGIAAASYPNEDIPNLTIDRAAVIYERDFWGASRCNEWRNQIVANLYFDFAVNMGQGTAARIIQRAINYAGWPRPPITVDGKIGSGTVKRLNEVDQVALFCNLVGLGHARYVQIVDANPKKMQFMSNWIATRLRKNVQRSVHEFEAVWKHTDTDLLVALGDGGDR